MVFVLAGIDDEATEVISTRVSGNYRHRTAAMGPVRRTTEVTGPGIRAGVDLKRSACRYGRDPRA